MLVMGSINLLIPRQLEAARTAMQFERVWILHGTAILLNLVGFWFACKIFLRRLRDILGETQISFVARNLIRISLLSPLLGVQIVVLAVFLPRAPRGYPRSGISILVVLALTSVCTHASYLLWSSQAGRVTFVSHETRFKPVVPGLSVEDQALREKIREDGIPEKYRRLTDALEVHLTPYLNPSLRVGVIAARDFLRVSSIDSILTGPRAKELCLEPQEYLGAKIDNCFFITYVRLAELEPFLSPAPALFFENRRRSQKQAASAADQSTTFGVDTSEISSDVHSQIGQMENAMASSLAMIENMVVMLDSSHSRLTAMQVVSPTMLLPLIGNAEIPFLEMARDLQQLSIAKLIYKTTAPSLAELGQQFEKTQLHSGQNSYAAHVQKIKDLERRLAQIDAHPFRRTSASAE